MLNEQLQLARTLFCILHQKEILFQKCQILEFQTG